MDLWDTLVESFNEALADLVNALPTIIGALVILLIGWMYHVIAHRPGGQPIGALEAAFSAIAKGVRKMLPNPRARALARRQAAREAREAQGSAAS